jgi:hypothetical protein
MLHLQCLPSHAFLMLSAKALLVQQATALNLEQACMLYCSHMLAILATKMLFCGLGGGC